MKKKVRARTPHQTRQELVSLPISRSFRTFGSPTVCSRLCPSPDTLSLKRMLGLAFVFLVFSSMFQGAPTDLAQLQQVNPVPTFSPSADEGAVVERRGYAILQMQAGDISPQGNQIGSLLAEYGISTDVLNVSSIDSLDDLADFQAIILDASCGSSSGVLLSQGIVSFLVQSDLPIILLGRASWVLHRLRGTSPPSQTASLTTLLQSSTGYSGAVYLSNPVSLTLGSVLTLETGLNLPIDEAQTSLSRIVDLTWKESSTALPPLRYDSYPNDVFLFGAEDVSLLTSTGEGLLVNTIAYATSLQETSLSTTIGLQQSSAGSALGGGLHYPHTPTMASAYHAVHMMADLLSVAEFSSWRSAKAPLVNSILSQLLVIGSGETSFKNDIFGSTSSLDVTAQALWLIDTMDLTGLYSVPDIVSYISSRQDPTGGFANDIDVTFYVVEALHASGMIGSIDTGDLEWWLRACVVSGADTGDTTQWGGIAEYPSSGDAKNSFAVHYLQSLWLLGKAHTDPMKLTEWIQNTANGDGSFRDTISPDEQITLGTSSALQSMSILGTLNAGNRSAGLSWFSINQLKSGSFGITYVDDDILGKTWTASAVSSCLSRISATSGMVASNLIAYCDEISTSSGFEAMEPVPSLMWSYWLGQAGRYSHSSSLNRAALESYLSYFEDVGFAMYPSWGNLTKTPPAEYYFQQYYDTGIWSQFFGVATALENGQVLPGGMISDITLYLSLRQRTSGHYRPSTSGIESMQYSVAAIETLYLLDEMDTIWYRSALETAVLNEYAGGQWSSASWTLEPFCNQQPAVDYLSTRAALRLGLVDSGMAAALRSNILSRIQYQDLYALSWDVSTLALLNASGFSVGLESLDEGQILTALQSHYTTGWFNATAEWQPLLTSQVLEMASILGLRPLMFQPDGTHVSAVAASTAVLGSVLSIEVAISSSLPSSTIFVSVFEQWIRFDNVLSSDTLLLQVPSSETILGPNSILLMVANFGDSRGFDAVSIEILGALEGTLDVDETNVVLDDLVNGTATWTLQGGGDAGPCAISIRLTNDTQYQQWNYMVESPFAFSIPTTDCTAGDYNLSVTISRSQCEDLVMWEAVSVTNPLYTHFTSDSTLVGDVGEQIFISWTLRFSANGTGIPGETVSLEIRDASETVVHSDTMVSTGGFDTFTWSPNDRGVYSFKLTFEGHGALVASEFIGSATVYHVTDLDWIIEVPANQYSTAIVAAYLRTSTGTPLPGQFLTVIVTAPDATIVLDTVFVTNNTGHASFDILLNQNGYYSIYVEFIAQGLLKGSNSTDSLLSWSPTELHMGGVPANTLTSEVHTIWGRILDVGGNPITGAQLQVTITYLPSTIVLQQTLVTNGTGYVSVPWSATNPGSYHIVFSFTGSTSRGGDSEDVFVVARIPTFVSVELSSNPEVGLSAWIFASVTDDMLDPLDLSVRIIICDPDGLLVLDQTDFTSGGSLNLTWVPTAHGLNNITVVVLRQSWYEASQMISLVGVYETPTVILSFNDVPVAPYACELLVQVFDNNGSPIAGVIVGTLVQLNGATLYNQFNATPADGIIHIWFTISNPGDLDIFTNLEPQGWLLESHNSTSLIALGATSLALIIPGQPIEQGTTLGITAILQDWAGIPLSGVPVTISILWTNGTILESSIVFTGSGGSCSIGFTFNYVADFWVQATFNGIGLNSSASNSRIQRVRVTPLMDLLHGPTSTTGDEATFEVGIRDALGSFISGRPLTLTITMNGATVYETSFLSASDLLAIHWTPSERGLAIITLTHNGDEFFLTNVSTSSMSVLTLVSGDIILASEEVDLFETVLITYNLTSGEPRAGVEIIFEVLGMDLVPVWTAVGYTNSLGLVSVTYSAVHSHGILQVIGAPSANQFMLGGDAQESLKVWTYGNVATSLAPTPPTTGTLTTVTVLVTDDLGAVIQGIRVAISVYDIYNSRLFTVYRDLFDGAAVVQFTPLQWGIYRVDVSSSGSETVHSFDEDIDDHMHTVYCPTSLTFIISSPEVEVGDPFTIIARLENVNGAPLVGMSINLSILGDSSLGPVTLVTDGNGDVIWSITLEEQGFWELRGVFYGLGTYLSTTKALDLHSCFGTSLDLELENTGDLIAGATPLNVSVLLVDSVGTPLEGRTITWEAYHDELGLLLTGSLVQQGIDPEFVIISIDIGGNITVVFSFAGSDHYHSSNAAIEVIMKGISELVLVGSGEIDRADTSPMLVQVLDEQGQARELSGLDCIVELTGVDLEGRLTFAGDFIRLNLTGVAVGNYSLNITVLSSPFRLGDELLCSIRVVTQTSILIAEATISGHVGVGHSLSVGLTDSLGDELDDLTLWVSLYHPDGREIYGGLESATPKTLQDGRILVSWLPSTTGNYTVVIRFQGDEWTLASEWNMTILTRRAVSMQVEHPEELEFSDDVGLSITITNGFSEVSGAEILVQLFLQDQLVFETRIFTGYGGSADVEFPELLAGEYSILVEYSGTDTLAPNDYTGSLRILPRMLIVFDKDSDLYVGASGFATITTQILGVEGTWNGTLQVEVFDPDGLVIFTAQWNISSMSIKTIEFSPSVQGTYTANITMQFLPVLGSSSAARQFSIGYAPMPISLDVATAPVAIAVPIVGILALVIRKRFGVDLPTEWTGI